jgi:hypothetical protein
MFYWKICFISITAMRCAWWLWTLLKAFPRKPWVADGWHRCPRRAIDDARQILACYLPVAVIQLFNGRREGDSTWQQYDEAWEKAEALKERNIAYLEQVAAEKGFTVRAAGVIDISETRPLPATWKSDPIRTVPDQGAE